MTDPNSEYDCEGCGIRAIAYGRKDPPRHMFCMRCLCINDMRISPATMVLLTDFVRRPLRQRLMAHARRLWRHAV